MFFNHWFDRDVPHCTELTNVVEVFIFQSKKVPNKTAIIKYKKEKTPNQSSIINKILKFFYYDKLSMKKIMAALNLASEQVAKNKKMKCLKRLRKLG